MKLLIQMKMMEAGATKTMMAVDHTMVQMEAGDIRMPMEVFHIMGSMVAGAIKMPMVAVRTMELALVAVKITRMKVSPIIERMEAVNLHMYLIVGGSTITSMEVDHIM